MLLGWVAVCVGKGWFEVIAAVGEICCAPDYYSCQHRPRAARLKIKRHIQETICIKIMALLYPKPLHLRSTNFRQIYLIDAILYSMNKRTICLMLI